MGRYFLSELWGVTHNYKKPEDFFKPKAETPEMLRGTALHLLCQERLKKLGYEVEPKREVSIGEVTIVGRADAVKDTREHGLEIKTSGKWEIMYKAKPWAIFQAKCEAALFEIPVFYVVQPILTIDGRFILKAIGEAERDDIWFTKVCEKVEAFHQKVLQLNVHA